MVLDFMLYKSAIQEETKYRFRKTTASKQTIEGVRSHYMCSQSGIYVYQVYTHTHAITHTRAPTSSLHMLKSSQ